MLPPFALADKVGTVKATQFSAYGTSPGEAKVRKFVRDNIVQDELLQTGNKSGIHLKFLDDTLLTLGSNSELVIDDFIYDPKGGNEAALYKLAIGTFRFVSGEMTKSGIRLETPTAYIGIRGSEATISVAEDGTTTVDVVSGNFSVESKADGSVAQVAPSQQVSVAPNTSVGDVGKGNDGYTGQGFVDSGGSSSEAGATGGGGGGGGGGGSSCLTGDTKVLMADGSLKFIKDIIVGERVMGHHGIINVVTGIETPRLGERQLYALSGGKPFVTAEHPFLTDEGWKSINPSATAAENPSMTKLIVGPLTNGDRMAVFSPPVDGKILATNLTTEFAVIGSITATVKDADTVVFNLLLDGNNTYFVTPSSDSRMLYLVHNKGY